VCSQSDERSVSAGRSSAARSGALWDSGRDRGDKQSHEACSSIGVRLRSTINRGESPSIRVARCELRACALVHIGPSNIIIR